MSEEKKFIVTETGFGERVIEKRFIGTWQVGEFGVLKIGRDGRETAQYQQHAWHSVRDEDATAPDSTLLALGVAVHTLREIERTNVTDTNEDGTLHKGVAVLKELARQGLDGVADEGFE